MYKLPTLQELLEAGVHFGHQVRRGHPRMKPYIYGAKDGVSVIDLTQSEKYLKEACEFVYNLGKEGKVLLFVGTKKQAQPIIEEEAKKLQEELGGQEVLASQTEVSTASVAQEGGKNE